MVKYNELNGFLNRINDFLELRNMKNEINYHKFFKGKNI